jgi:RNA polymerase sigma-70 factor (ECF subfamily)
MNGAETVSLADLLAAAADGDRKAFRSLYVQAGPRLFAVCLRMMKARDQAEDVLQETFVRVWERSWQFDPAKGEAMAWLVAITRHCALDRLRRQPPRQVAIEDAELEGAEDEAIPSEGADLRRCLGRIRSDYRHSVVLAYVHGFSHEELAQRLAKPIGTVKSWIKRGLEQLKACMDGH